MKILRKPSWSVSVSIALIAITTSFGVTPIVVNAAAPTNPTMSVVPSFTSVPLNGGTDFSIYVLVPNNPPVGGTILYDLQPAFVVESISQGFTDPNGGVGVPSTLVTCKTTKTSGGHMGDTGYPSRLATTTCSGLYEQRVISRAYWGSNTTIYFLGLTGFSIPGTWTISFIVTGLYYLNTITLTASARLQIGSTASGAAPPSSQSPSASVVPTRPSISVNGYSDFTVYVQDPNNPPVSGTFHDLQPAFIVQSISSSVTYPNGTVVNLGTLVTCTTAATNKYPGYPSSGAITACAGQYPARVDPRAYWGSNTAIYFISIVGFNAPGTWTVTFTVTGLYYGSTITLTASAKIMAS